MSQARHLSVYSQTYKYLKEIHRIKLKLSKVLKYDLGNEAATSSLKILKCIVLANRSQDKTRYLVLSEYLSDIERQSEAWLWQQKEMQRSKSQPPGNKNIGNPRNLI